MRNLYVTQVDPEEDPDGDDGEANPNQGCGDNIVK